MDFGHSGTDTSPVKMFTGSPDYFSLPDVTREIVSFNAVEWLAFSSTVHEFALSLTRLPAWT